MKPEEYWAQRAEQVLLASEKHGVQLTRELIGVYSDTVRKLQAEIDAFYGRYAQDNQVSIEETHRRLDAAELKSFRVELDFYLAEANRLGLGSQHADYLRALSARTYISRQQALLAQARHQIEVLFGKEEESLNRTLVGVYGESYYHTIFGIHQGFGIGADFARMDTKAIESIVRRPWLGESYSSRIWQNKTRLVQQLEQTIPQAFALGQNSRVLGRQVADRLGVSRSAGERLIRTEVNHAANEATRQSYRECGVEQYEYLATLDNRTSAICASLDGKVFRLADAAAGVNYPPMHPNCRSTTVPYFPPDEFDEHAVRAARDLGGRYHTVPASMTYPEWQRKYLGEKLTLSEERAIKTYIGAPSYALNAKLRDSDALTTEEKRTVRALDSAIEKLPKYEGTVQRSLFFETDEEANRFALSLLDNGLHPAYTSASTGVYDENDSIRLIIQSKNAADLRGFNRREQEILFPRGTFLRVVDMRIVDGKRTIWLEEE